MSPIEWGTVAESSKLGALRDSVSRRIPASDAAAGARQTLTVAGWLFHPHQVLPARQAVVASRGSADRIVLGTPNLKKLATEQVAELLAAGAEDIFDFSQGALEQELERLRILLSKWQSIEDTVDSTSMTGSLIGRCPSWRAALRSLVEAAIGRSQAVLVRGETGTGKEAAARLVHRLSPGETRPFVPVDCAASVEGLFAAELFGHRKGAFTGAVDHREGALARAHGGTLFLDELGELRPAMQASLLRVLQERSYTQVGSAEVRGSTFRLVSATHRHLGLMIDEGTFRQDLFHRVAQMECTLPPLRERSADIPLLLEHFLGECGCQGVTIDGRVAEWLGGLPWPGNVRELRAVAFAVANHLNGAREVRLAHLPRSLLGPGVCRTHGLAAPRSGLREAIREAVGSGATLNQILDSARDEAVRSAVDLAGGKSAEAAAKLGVSERMVQLRRRSWVRPVAPAGGEAHPELEATDDGLPSEGCEVG